MSLPIGHLLAGVCVHAAMAPRVKPLGGRLAWALTALLPQVPDFDFFAVWVLDQPSHVWHRTWSHSLLFALVCGLLGVALWRRAGDGEGADRDALWIGLFAALLVLSHDLVDMLGYGGGGAPGRGVALWWPLSDVAVAAPAGWQVLPPGIWDHGRGPLKAALMECAWLGPPALIAAGLRWGRRVPR